MKFVLVTKDAQIEEAAQNAYRGRDELLVYQDWAEALEAAGNADLMFVDLIATLRQAGKIEGYEEFAYAKMQHEKAATIPLVVIAPPAEYELDGMVGWPNFVFAMVRRPVQERLFRQASGWV